MVVISCLWIESICYRNKISVDLKYVSPENKFDPSKNAYGYLAKWQSLKDAKFIGQLMDQGVTARTAKEKFTIEEKEYPAGTLIITRGDNRKLEDNFEKTIIETAAKLNYENLTAVSTGFADSGADLGSESLILLKKPKVAVLAGDKTSPYSFGQIWHFFETDLDYPLTTVPVKNFQYLNLENYSLIILPEGWYSLSDGTLDKLKTWIRSGGRVIAVGSGVSKLEGKPGFNLKKYAEEGDKNEANRVYEKETLASRLEPHSHRRRNSIKNNMPGAIFKLNWDNTHPLGFGMSDYYFSLKTSSRHFQYLKNTSNVGYIGKDQLVLGFAGSKTKKNQEETTVFAVQRMGRGNVTYMVDNPLFRAFWYQGKMVFANAIFLNQ